MTGAIVEARGGGIECLLADLVRDAHLYDFHIVQVIERKISSQAIRGPGHRFEGQYRSPLPHALCREQGNLANIRANVEEDAAGGDHPLDREENVPAVVAEPENLARHVLV